MTITTEQIKNLYTAPFILDKFAGTYIWDSKHNMVADFYNTNDGLRPRGWGRFKYMDNGAELHDAVQVFLLNLCKDFLTDKQKCLDAINKEWVK